MGRKHVNFETGEVTIEPDFVKLYTRDMCKLKGLTGLQHHIFFFMLENMNPYNEVSYGKDSKDRFIKEHETSKAAFNNNINPIIDSGLIQRTGRGSFRINKKYATKVDWDKVQKIVWTVEYTRKGKSDKVDIT